VVLAGWDGSAVATRALARAAALARPGDAVVCVAVCVPRMLTLTERLKTAAGNTHLAAALRDLNAEHERQLTAQATALLTGDARFAAVTLAVRRGPRPAAVLATECGLRHAAVLVVGSHGAGLAERLLAGSTAEERLHTAAVPVVVVVRPEAAAA
jgi:nucleotide-binding universal stress UspA family protein